MDDDEIRVFAEGKPVAPPYRAEARARARERLLAEAHGGGRLRLPWLGWQAMAAFGATIVLVGGVAVALSRQGGGPGPATSPTQSAVVFEELDPKPGQYILIESDTMYGSYGPVENGEEVRYLYRTHRKIWQSADGGADGLLMIENREPEPWPGRELPEVAKRDDGGTRWHALPRCPGTRADTAYDSLSTLPADADAMREQIYRKVEQQAGERKSGSERDRDAAAFDYVSDLLTETYLPKAQREALFAAAEAIPGVQVAEGVADSAGRKGTALGRNEPYGTFRQLIFDPATHTFMGERQTVVDEKTAQAPAGSVVALTAQLSVSAVDKLPEEVPLDGNATCMPASAAPSETSEPTDEPASATDEAKPAITVTATPSDERPGTDRPRPAITVTVAPSDEGPGAGD
jgi:hypothetical protein